MRRLARVVLLPVLLMGFTLLHVPRSVDGGDGSSLRGVCAECAACAGPSEGAEERPRLAASPESAGSPCCPDECAGSCCALASKVLEDPRWTIEDRPSTRGYPATSDPADGGLSRLLRPPRAPLA